MKIIRIISYVSSIAGYLILLFVNWEIALAIYLIVFSQLLARRAADK
jgi:hypothetical protein